MGKKLKEECVGHVYCSEAHKTSCSSQLCFLYRKHSLDFSVSPTVSDYIVIVTCVCVGIS